MCDVEPAWGKTSLKDDEMLEEQSKSRICSHGGKACHQGISKVGHGQCPFSKAGVWKCCYAGVAAMSDGFHLLDWGRCVY